MHEKWNYNPGAKRCGSWDLLEKFPTGFMFPKKIDLNHGKVYQRQPLEPYSKKKNFQTRLAAANAIMFALLMVFLGKLLFGHTDTSLLFFLYGLSITTILLIVFHTAFTKYRDPFLLAQNLPEWKRKDYRISLMIAVRNEEDIIRQCVESCINQTHKNLEVIVVNDASTDRTGEILDEYVALGQITAIHLEKNVMKKRALGIAALHATGEIYAHTDSDSVLHPDALARCIDIFNYDPDIGAISGHVRLLNHDTNFLTRVLDTWYEGQYSVRKAFESAYGSVTCVSGPLAVFRKEAVYNFFPAWENDQFLGQEFKFATDRTLTGFILGNKYLGKQVKEKYADSPFIKNADYPLRDWKIVYTKAARAWTTMPDTFRKLIKQQIRWKKSFIRNTFFTGKFFWRKHPLVALNYYLHALFVIVGPFIAFRHLIYLPIKGHPIDVMHYLSGIILVGLLFGLAYRLEEPERKHRWVLRPVMSLLSTIVLSFLIFYSAVTIKKMVWRG